MSDIFRWQLMKWKIPYYFNLTNTGVEMNNMGSLDRIIRSIVAILLIILYVNGIIYGNFGIALIIISSVLLLTSAINYCPFYELMHIASTKNHIHKI